LKCEQRATPSTHTNVKTLAKLNNG